MASVSERDGNGDTMGSMWDLGQKLDQPMDEEAGRLKNMYREKVWCFTLFSCIQLDMSLILLYSCVCV